MNGEEGDWGYSMTFYKMLHIPLAPGPELDAMNRVMAQKVSASMSESKAGTLSNSSCSSSTRSHLQPPTLFMAPEILSQTVPSSIAFGKHKYF